MWYVYVCLPWRKAPLGCIWAEQGPMHIPTWGWGHTTWAGPFTEAQAEDYVQVLRQLQLNKPVYA